MEFLLLGPVEVRRAGQRVAVGGPQAEKALATLLLAGGRVVGLDPLVDALWDAEPPPTAVHQVHKLIGGLRRRIPGVIDTDGHGYRIRPGAGTLDVDRFEQLARRAEIPDLVAALALWRGTALAGVDSRVLRTAATALDDRRLRRAGAAHRPAAGRRPGRHGRHRAAAAGRRAPAAGNPAPAADDRALPLRPAGRGPRRVRGDPQPAGRGARPRPRPELVRLHQQILRADPALEPDRPRPPCTLPYDLPDFAGRGDDLDRLLHAGPAVVITAIDGMAGIGKTALAVHAAYRLADRFPDGQLFCDLHSHTPGARPLEPAEALERLLRMIGVPPETIPAALDERVARWRAELAGRRVLVVLDNAVSAAQVRPLLPGSPHALVLVTSRRRLGVLDGATVLSLDVLPWAEALALFGAVAGAARVAAEPAAAAEVVRLCGRLPLALRIAGSRLAHRPGWTVAALADRLRERADRLDELTLADRGVGPAFALSYAQLAPAEQRMFRLLGVHPGADFDAWSAAALAGCTPRAAEDVLEALVDAHLLRSARAGPVHLPRPVPGVRPRPGAGEPERRGAGCTTTTWPRRRRDRPDQPPRCRRFEPRLARPPAQLPDLADLDAALAWLATEHTDAGRGDRDDRTTGSWPACCGRSSSCAGTSPTGGPPTSGRCGWPADRPARAGAAPVQPRRAVHVDRPAGRGMAHLRRRAAARGDRPLEATTLTSLGMLAHLLHRDAEAARHLRRALAIDQTTPGRRRSAGTTSP